MPLTLERRGARENAARRGWGIDDSAARIETIDAFACATPTRAHHLASRVWSSIADDPADLALAARETLRRPSGSNVAATWNASCGDFDDNWPRLERPIAGTACRGAEWADQSAATVR